MLVWSVVLASANFLVSGCPVHRRDSPEMKDASGRMGEPLWGMG
jgi:hypothetical protein